MLNNIFDRIFKNNSSDKLASVKHFENVNLQNKNGDTALHIAARNLDIRNIYILLNAGANPNIKNDNGKTAFTEADQRLVDLLHQAMKACISGPFDGLNYIGFLPNTQKPLDEITKNKIISIMTIFSFYGAQINIDPIRMGLEKEIQTCRENYQKHVYLFKKKLYHYALNIALYVGSINIPKEIQKEIAQYYSQELNPDIINDLLNIGQNIKTVLNEYKLKSSSDSIKDKVYKFVHKTFDKDPVKTTSNKIREILNSPKQLSWQSKFTKASLPNNITENCR